MDRTALRAVVLSLVLFAAAAPTPVRGESDAQTFTLKGGWNAVFLEVQPGLNPAPPGGCVPSPGRSLPHPCEIFGAIPDVVSVWAWNPLTSPVEFVVNPDQPLLPLSYMQAWFKDNAPSNLSAVNGGRAYLIRRSAAAGTFAWTMSGEPLVPAIDWKADSFNLVGFHLADGTGPTFAEFFAASPAHDGQEAYYLDNGTATWVKALPSDRLKRGEAFWVYSKGASQFNGPLEVRLENSAGLEYGQVLNDQRLRLVNRTGSAVAAGITVSSAAPQLKYYFTDLSATPPTDWRDVPTGVPLAYSLASGESREVTLGVLRAGIPAGERRTANLRVTGGGMRILIPVGVNGISSRGLWVGDVTIHKVCQPQFHSGPPANPVDPDPPGPPGPTGSEFSFRVIVHLDDTDKVRLLREVVQLWNEPAKQYVLVANEARIGEFTPGALRDGQPVGRRISTAAFGFSGAREMTGDFALGGAPLAVEVVLPWDDPTNPFLHRYHPDHSLIEQVYEIGRDIRMELKSRDDEGKLIAGAPLLGWGSADVGGVYREKVSLKKQIVGDVKPYVVHIEGTFLLHRVSGIDRLEL